jgi:hypothetical protein
MKSNTKSEWLEAIAETNAAKRKPKPSGYLDRYDLSKLLGVTQGRAVNIARELVAAGKAKEDFYVRVFRKTKCWKLL